MFSAELNLSYTHTKNRGKCIYTREVKFIQRANTRRPIFIARMRDPTADWPGIIEDLRRGI